MNNADPISERLSQLEESQKYLASKEDVQAIRGEFLTALASMESRLAWRMNGLLLAFGLATLSMLGILIFR